MKDNHHIIEERYDWETVTYRFAAESERRLSGLGQHRRGNKLPPYRKLNATHTVRVKSIHYKYLIWAIDNDSNNKR